MCHIWHANGKTSKTILETMKKLLITLAIGATASSAMAQFQVNPQAGLTFQSLTDAPNGTDYKAQVGWQLGADVRFGDRLFIQPGAFIGRSVTAITTTIMDSNGGSGTVEVEDNLVRTNLKLRAQLGYRLVDSYQFDLRFMLGPSYDVLMSIDDQGDKLNWNEANFNKGSFNIDMGLGFDMGLITVSPTASFGLSRVFTDDPALSDINSKYISYGLTLGVNIGNDD
jgi:opacity protein-like surface antigen